MYFKGITYVAFVALFMWLGSVASDMVAEEIDHVAVDHEEFVANTSSYISQQQGWYLPGVFIVIPTKEGIFAKELSCKEYVYKNIDN